VGRQHILLTIGGTECRNGSSVPNTILFWHKVKIRLKSGPTSCFLSFIYLEKEVASLFAIMTFFREKQISVNSFDCVFLEWRKDKEEFQDRNSNCGQLMLVNRGVTLVVCTRQGNRSVGMRSQTHSQGWVTYGGVGMESYLSIYNGSDKAVGVKYRGDLHPIQNPYELE